MRAVFAVLGFVAFYAVTAAAIVGLVWLGFLCFGLLDSIRVGKAMLLLVLVGGACLLSAAVLAWSALPRIDKFEAPGPELTETSHPELFKMIREVAAATNQRMPVHVYAVLEVNAFVTERGGIMGIGSKRVMGIGIGLLNAFTVDEVRAVVAHEFGHFHGGDTRLGPWVYKTRAAMGRAVINLQSTIEKVSEIEAVGFVLSIIEAPFRWMTLGYMRLASAVSRAQEYSADAVAARAVGTAPVLSGFGRLAGTAAALDAYLDSEIGALVGHGVLPPVLAGARQFVEANRDRLAEIDADSAKLGEVSPFDSHPPLSERISAVERLTGAVPERSGQADDRRATVLIRHPEKLGRAFIRERVSTPLTDVEWTEVAPVFVRSLHGSLEHHRRWLAERSVAELDRSVDTARTLATMIDGLGAQAYELDRDVLVRIQGQIYTAALSIALAHVGYEPRTAPGEPLRFHLGDQTIEPGPLVAAYLAGELSDADWSTTWAEAGLPEQPWAGLVAPGMPWADVAWTP
jgi:heat shock protein HtpX